MLVNTFKKTSFQYNGHLKKAKNILMSVYIIRFAVNFLSLFIKFSLSKIPNLDFRYFYLFKLKIIVSELLNRLNLTF